MTQGTATEIDRTVPDADISLGREMRRAREVRGITVQQIAQETKINERYIHALENDRLDLLPGQPYVSNFVRSIARCVGADEEELIDYLNYQLRTLHPERRDESRPGGRERSRAGMPLILAVGAVLVVVLLTIALRSSDDDAKGGATPGARPPAPAGFASAPAPGTTPDASAAIDAGGAAAEPPPGTLPAVLGGLATAPAPGPAAEGGASAPMGGTGAAMPGDEAPAPAVRLVFREKSWIEVQQVGDEVPHVEMVEPGEEVTRTLDRPLTLKITNAGGVDLFIDGQAAKPLGGPRETRTLVLDRKNWKSYLR